MTRGVGALAAALLLTACGSAQPAAPAGSCAGVGAAPAALPGARSFVYKRAGRPLRIHVYAPRGLANRSAVLFFFGGGWRQGSVRVFEPQARALAARGYVTALADYRVTCRDRSNPLRSTADARDAYRWMRAHASALGADPRRIVLSGGSAGGQLALATAMLEPEKPAALVLFNPAVDLVGPAPLHLKLFARTISPSVLPLDALPPAILFHGQADRTVPVATVRAFCARARSAGRSCRLVTYRGQGHGFYHSSTVDPLLGRALYDDTLARMERFLAEQGLARP